MNLASFLAGSQPGWASAPTVRSGIYLLVLNGDIVYVGCSRNICARIGTHSKRNFDQALWLEMPYELALRTEGALARALDPQWCQTSPADVGNDAALLKPFGLVPDPSAAFARRRTVHHKGRGKKLTALEKRFRRRVAEKRRSTKRVQAFIEAA